MSNVTLQIGGRKYTVACQDGEEAHIARLGRHVDAKLAEMGGGAGQSESRSLLFATLLLADEVFELKGQAGGANTGESATSPAPALEALAERMEKLAEALEGGHAAP